jgi:hypothetical protein
LPRDLHQNDAGYCKHAHTLTIASSTTPAILRLSFGSPSVGLPRLLPWRCYHWGAWPWRYSPGIEHWYLDRVS